MVVSIGHVCSEPIMINTVDVRLLYPLPESIVQVGFPRDAK